MYNPRLDQETFRVQYEADPRPMSICRRCGCQCELDARLCDKCIRYLQRQARRRIRPSWAKLSEVIAEDLTIADMLSSPQRRTR